MQKEKLLDWQRIFTRTSYKDRQEITVEWAAIKKDKKFPGVIAFFYRVGSLLRASPRVIYYALIASVGAIVDTFILYVIKNGLYSQVLIITSIFALLIFVILALKPYRRIRPVY